MNYDIKFKSWWKSNKDNYPLTEEYASYKKDCKSVDAEPMTYSEWVYEFYVEFIN
jgi:hypothetical protein